MRYGRPTIDQYMPELCWVWPWWTVRTTASRSARWASRGSSSDTRSPGTRVAIGLNGPRTFCGASGLGSQRSRWLGAPQLKIRMTALALPAPAVGPEEFQRPPAGQAEEPPARGAPAGGRGGTVREREWRAHGPGGREAGRVF